MSDLENNYLEEERIREFIKMFESNMEEAVPRAAIQKLMDIGTIPQEGVLKCPNGHSFSLTKCNTLDGWIWRCRLTMKKGHKKACKCDFKRSLRKGTFFEKSHLSLLQILQFVFMWLKNVPLQLIRSESAVLGNSSGVDWNNFCREVVIFSSIQTNTIEVGGPGVVVEIDESKIGKGKYNRGHAVEDQWVFGGVERVSNKCFVVPVEDRRRETLLPHIKKHIRPGSIIISDCWEAYDSLDEEGYVHFTVNHSKNVVDPINREHTNTIEGLWRHIKASLPKYNRRKYFFNGYVQKYMFLRWCKANNKCPFKEFLYFAGQWYNAANDSPNALREECHLMASEDFIEQLDKEEEINC